MQMAQQQMAALQQVAATQSTQAASGVLSGNPTGYLV
jgi:hypothetical protein